MGAEIGEASAQGDGQKALLDDSVWERRSPIAGTVQLSEEIASYVRQLIMSGQLKSGEQILIDRLARELDISATPVREALLLLRGEGFVEQEPRRGYRVSPITRGDVGDVFLVQSIIAGELAARAARAATDSLLTSLESLQERMRTAASAEAYDQVERLNHAFHKTLNNAAESRKLAWLLSVTVHYVPGRFYAMIPGWLDASTKDHEAILKALRTRDPELARSAMAAHITHAGDLLIKHLERSSFWETTPTGAAEA